MNFEWVFFGPLIYFLHWFFVVIWFFFRTCVLHGVRSFYWIFLTFIFVFYQEGVCFRVEWGNVILIYFVIWLFLLICWGKSCKIRVFCLLYVFCQRYFRCVLDNLRTIIIGIVDWLVLDWWICTSQKLRVFAFFLR